MKSRIESNRVIVRCQKAGVHVGTLDPDRNTPQTLRLLRANRIYRWRGAHDLSYVAMHGVNRKEYTRISVQLPYIDIPWLDIGEIIPVANGVDLTEVQNA